jgi:hypothetical protein
MSKKQPNRLSQENLLKLSDWLKNNKDSLEKLPHSLVQVADMASKELGFPIVGSSIQRVSSYCGVNIKTLPGQGGGKQAKINTIRLQKLREHLVLLYQKVGEPTPEEIGVNW